MSKNVKGKGGKKKRRGKNDTGPVSRKLILADSDDQEYAQVIKLLGNARLQAKCFKKNKTTGEFTSKTRICLIRGKMRKRVWINNNDMILVSLREFDDDKGDVIHKYEDNETKKLMKNNHIPNIVLNTHVTEKKEETHIETNVVEETIAFEHVSDDEDEMLLENI